MKTHLHAIRIEINDGIWRDFATCFSPQTLGLWLWEAVAQSRLGQQAQPIDAIKIFVTRVPDETV